jgi:hypothetical protein
MENFNEWILDSEYMLPKMKGWDSFSIWPESSNHFSTAFRKSNTRLRKLKEQQQNIYLFFVTGILKTKSAD